MEALRDLADDFNVRDPRKLYRLARQRDLDVTQAMAFEALKADVGRQVQAPRPRALGKSAAEGPNDRLQADLIDFSQNTRGKTKYGLVVMDVFKEACSHLLVLRPPLGLPGFHLVQPGLEALAHPPQHAGEVRVVEGNHLRAVAYPSGSSTSFLRSRPRRSPASSPRSCPGACTAWPPRSRRAAGAPPRRPPPSPSSPGCPTNS